MNSRSQLSCLCRLTGTATLAAMLAATSRPAEASPEPVSENAPEPSDAEVALDAGRAAASEGNYEAALEHYLRARDLDPTLNIDEPLAMAHFQIGTEAYSAGDYEAALRRFQDAQGLYSSPNFHYNIGQCYEALERPQQSIDSYRAYLRAVPDTPDRANIENKIARLEKRIRDEQAEDEAGSTSASPTPTSRATPADEPKNPGRGMIASGAVLTGIGAAVAIGGGMAFGLRALDRSDRVNQVFEDGNPDGLTANQTERLDAEGRQAQTGQIITMAAGGAVAAVGVTLLALGITERKRAGRLETAATPMLGRGLAGFSLTGRF